jgi:hypothetical protein
MTEHIYKIWDKREETYVSAGRASRSIWTKQHHAERHVELDNEIMPGRYEVHRFALVRSEL